MPTTQTKTKKTPASRPNTANRGKADFAESLKDHLKRVLKDGGQTPLGLGYIDGDKLLEWVNNWDARKKKAATKKTK